MKKGMIITLIVAGALLVLGILLIITGLSLKSFHITKVFTEGGNMTERTVELQDTVEEVSVSDLHGASIDIVCADTAKVDVKEPKDYTFTITENAGKLSITSDDQRGLFFRISEPKLVVYLPAAEYRSLSIDSQAGYVKVADGFTFQNATVMSSSGSVTFASDVREDLTVDVTSGSLTLNGVSAGNVKTESASGGVTLEEINCDSLSTKVISGGIKATGISASGDLAFEGHSGGLHFTDITCQNLKTTNTSGGTDLKNAIIQEELSISNVSGGIRIENSDAKTIGLKATSGSIKAEFLTYKDFRADAGSGSVTLPEPMGEINGTCVANTTSGSIKISVKD